MNPDPLVVELRQQRIANHLSQRQFATMVQTQQSAVSEAERGVTGIHIATLRRWADALGFDLVLIKREPGPGVGDRPTGLVVPVSGGEP